LNGVLVALVGAGVGIGIYVYFNQKASADALGYSGPPEDPWREMTPDGRSVPSTNSNLKSKSGLDGYDPSL
jgi:hypothetical protein